MRNESRKVKKLSINPQSHSAGLLMSSTKPCKKFCTSCHTAMRILFGGGGQTAALHDCAVIPPNQSSVLHTRRRRMLNLHFAQYTPRSADSWQWHGNKKATWRWVMTSRVAYYSVYVGRIQPVCLQEFSGTSVGLRKIPCRSSSALSVELTAGWAWTWTRFFFGGRGMVGQRVS